MNYNVYRPHVNGRDAKGINAGFIDLMNNLLST